MNYLIPVYNKLPITLVRGEGVWLYDDQGNQYLDALSGIGVCALGHNHPNITRVIREQAEQLLHVATTYRTTSQEALAKKLCELTGLSAVGFSNSGTEANEAAIKMALKFGKQQGIEAPKIIVMKGGFHGRSLGAWSGSCDHSQSQFGPLLPCFLRAEFNDFSAAKALVESNKEVCAIMLEPVFGKGGLLPADTRYLEQLRELCDEHNLLLIFDEVQSGMGRTGKLFAYQHSKIKPDIVTTAKALGNGVPIGTYIASKKASDIFKSGDHGSTQAGNAFCCTIALEVLNTLEQENLYQNAAEIGEYLHQKLSEALQPFSLFSKVQGKGLMIGIQLKQNVAGAIPIGLKHGLIFNHAGKDVIRLLPPFILTTEHADMIVTRIVQCFKELSGN